jgi:magnesium chelatase subunit D
VSVLDPEEPLIAPVDLRKKVRTRFRRNLVVFLVDASDSMGVEERMAASKGAVLALLTDAYQERDMVSVVMFRDEQGMVLLQPTTSVELARERLHWLPAGGSTPFADGLYKAWNVITMQRKKDPRIEPILVVISDGEANVPLTSGKDVVKELLTLAREVRKDRIACVAIDTSPMNRGKGNMVAIAKALGARYYHVDHLRVNNIVDAVRGYD